MTLRAATMADVSALNALIAESARSLSHGYYSDAVIEAAIRHVYGVDSRLIEDGTYYAVTDGDRIVACGGWSRRRTLYGGDQRPVGGGGAGAELESLDPAVDAARIRAFFVSGTHARRGIGARILEACEAAAAAAGFTRFELMSTLPGVPFYARLGFESLEPVTDALPDGTTIEFVRMARAVKPA